MALYEHIFICRQDISPQQVEELSDTFSAVIKTGGGKICKTEYWGLRNLAFRVKKNRKGHYSLFNIDAPHDAVAEMERQMSLNDDVIRFLTIRVDEHDEEPSPALQSKKRDYEQDDDDDRGGRSDRGYRSDRGDRGGYRGDRSDRGGYRGYRGDRRDRDDRDDRNDRADRADDKNKAREDAQAEAQKDAHADVKNEPKTETNSTNEADMNKEDV